MARNSIFKNIIYQSILTFFNFLLPFFTGTYVVRVLSVESYGVFNTASAYLSVFITIGSLAIGSYGVRELSQSAGKAEFEKIYSELFLMRAFCNIITFAVCTVCLVWAVEEHLWIYIILSFQIITNIFGVEWVNSAKEEFKFITFKTIIIRILYVILLLIFVRNENDVLQYCLAIAIAEFLNNIVSFLYISKDAHINLKNINITRHFKNIAILTLSSNVGILYTSLDKVFLAWFCGEKSVSYYTITATIFSMLATLFSGIIGGVTPRLSYLRKNNNMEYKLLLERTMDAYAFLLIPACLGAAVLAPEALILYGSEKYLAATPAMVAAGFYKIFMSYEGIIATLVLYQYGKEKLMLIFLTIFGFGNLISNIILSQVHLLSEVTTIMTSILIHLAMIVTYIIYIREKIDKELVVISHKQIRYLGIALIFIPISVVIHIYINNIIGVLVAVIFSCSVLYIGILYIVRDSTLMDYLNKIREIMDAVQKKKNY